MPELRPPFRSVKPVTVIPPASRDIAVPVMFASIIVVSRFCPLMISSAMGTIRCSLYVPGETWTMSPLLDASMADCIVG